MKGRVNMDKKGRQTSNMQPGQHVLSLELSPDSQTRLTENVQPVRLTEVGREVVDPSADVVSSVIPVARVKPEGLVFL